MYVRMSFVARTPGETADTGNRRPVVVDALGNTPAAFHQEREHEPSKEHKGSPSGQQEGRSTREGRRQQEGRSTREGRRQQEGRSTREGREEVRPVMRRTRPGRR